jgi:hypothetical protein
MSQDFLHESSFPEPLIIPLVSFRIFFENSHIHSQLKVAHRCRQRRYQVAANGNKNKSSFKQNMKNIFPFAIVSLTPVLQIELQNFEKNRNGPNGKIRGPGENFS